MADDGKSIPAEGHYWLKLLSPWSNGTYIGDQCLSFRYSTFGVNITVCSLSTVLYCLHTVGSRVVLNNAAQRENVHVRADI